MLCLSSPRALIRGTRGYAPASARPTRACRSTTRSKSRDAFVSIVASAGHEPPQSSSSRDARLESARVPRRAALTYPALALGTALVASVPGGARADETAADDSIVAALEAPPVVEIPPEVGLAIDADAPGGPVAHVEGLATMETVVAFLEPLGYRLPIVPELKHITVGGAISGVGIESGSFRHGWFHEALVSAEVLSPGGTRLLFLVMYASCALAIWRYNSARTAAEARHEARASVAVEPVSYTHLTLPTILLV